MENSILVDEDKYDNFTSVEIYGQLTSRSIIKFRKNIEEIIRNADTNIVFDFIGVHYMDCSGLGILVNIKKIMDSKDLKFCLLNCSGEVFDIIDISHLTKKLNIFNDEESFRSYIKMTIK